MLRWGEMPFKIISKKKLAEKIKMIEIEAPLVARSAMPGQFVIIRVDQRGERIPLTIVDWNPSRGTITLVFREIGLTTMKLGRRRVGEEILDVVGPLGNPSQVLNYDRVCMIGEGVRISSLYPRLKYLKKCGSHTVVIAYAKSGDEIIMEDEISRLSDEYYVVTSDGTRGFKGTAAITLHNLLKESKMKVEVVLAVGSPLMLRSIAAVTKRYQIRTIADLSPIMLDGLGMCGCCRVIVGNEVKFACIDGPEFDAHLVDYDNLISRMKMYRSEEQLSLKIHMGG